ncbi:MAG: hypothetical protein K2G31_04840, partial [Clostridia bacterium]|nr:hypothetical protein [Clostridia bacterium]
YIHMKYKTNRKAALTHTFNSTKQRHIPNRKRQTLSLPMLRRKHQAPNRHTLNLHSNHRPHSPYHPHNKFRLLSNIHPSINRNSHNLTLRQFITTKFFKQIAQAF